MSALPVDREDIQWDLEKVLPISLIRDHTKTNDLETVSDEQLALYRESAFEGAQAYTGLWLGGKLWVTETLRPNRKPLSEAPRTVKTRWPVSSGEVFVLLEGSEPFREITTPGARSVVVRRVAAPLSFNRCCNPCASLEEPGRLMYWTGFDCLTKIPAGIRVGMLKYIAYQVSNPGSIAIAYTGGRAQNAIRDVNNNALIASGALAEWKKYVSLRAS